MRKRRPGLDHTLMILVNLCFVQSIHEGNSSHILHLLSLLHVNTTHTGGKTFWECLLQREQRYAIIFQKFQYFQIENNVWHMYLSRTDTRQQHLIHSKARLIVWDSCPIHVSPFERGRKNSRERHHIPCWTVQVKRACFGNIQTSSR